MTITFSFGQNQNISNGFVFDGEPYLSINPNNLQHIVIAWMGWKLNNRLVIKTKVSFDGGQSWSATNNLPHTVTTYTSADVSIEFDNNGNLYASYIDFTGYDINPFNGGIYVCKSSDGGLTWGNPVEVININSDPNKRPIDRPWISIDQSNGANQGNIYITSMNAKGAIADYNPYLTVSIDGANSFNQWRYIDTTNWLAGPYISQPMPTNCVSANGTFYVAYPSYVPSQSLYAQFILASSTDGGNSLSHNSMFFSSTSVSDSLAKTGYLLRADPSDPNHLAFFYLDVTYGDIDVFMRESFDAGTNWTSPIRINDDAISNDRMQDLLWADFDNDGDLAVSWRDRRNGADSTYETAYEIMCSVRDKDSTNFSANFLITDQIVAYDTILTKSGNDFMCIKLVNDTLNAVWGDTRTGKLNIWFQRMSLEGVILSTKKISTEKNPEIFIYPNPSSSVIYIKSDQLKKVNVYNIIGEKIIVKMNKNGILKIDLSNFTNGTYLIEAITTKGIVTQKVQKY